MRNLLFLSHRLPYPPEKGEKIRAWHMLRHLAGTHRVHLGCLVDDPADREHLPLLRSLCAEVACFEVGRLRRVASTIMRLRPGRPLSLGYFHDRRLQRWVEQTLRTSAIDDIFVFSSTMAPYVMDAPARTRILDMVDVDSEKWAAYAAFFRWPKSSVWAREGRTLLAFERMAAKRFDRTLFVSGDERRRFVSLAPECTPRAGWVENGVEATRFSPSLAFETPFSGEAPRLVFTGTMNYWPNEDAVIWFAREVMPLLRGRQIPPEFYIVGGNPSRHVLKLATELGVHVIGRVPDTRPYLAHASVVVAPLRVARGIQNKVLEAMAMGRPVVASPEAFEGVRARPGCELLVAAGAARTAQAIGELLDGRHPGLGAAARAAIERHYDWSATLRPLDLLFADVPPPPSSAAATRPSEAVT